LVYSEDYKGLGGRYIKNLKLTNAWKWGYTFRKCRELCLPHLGETYFFCNSRLFVRPSVNQSVCQSVFHKMFPSPPRWLIIETRNFVQCFIISSKCASFGDGSNRIQSFSLSYGGSKIGGGCEIACALLSSEMAAHRDLELCGMLHCHLEVCILSGQEDPIIFLWDIVDPERWRMLKVLHSRFLIDSRVDILKRCTMSYSFGDVYIIGTGGCNYELWWIQKVCLWSFLFLYGQLERLETLLGL
jgi:hypothetical protein